MAAPKNNTFGARPENEKTNSQLQIRCRTDAKENWRKAAGGPGKLAGWVIETLNKKAQKAVKVGK